MGRLLQNLLSLIGLPSDLDSFIKLLGLSAGISAMTGGLQYLSGGGWAWTAMFAVAGFAFSSMATYYIILTKKMTSVFEQISLPEITIAEGGIAVDPPVAGKRGKPNTPAKLKKITHLALQCKLRNHSERALYFKLKRASHSMQGKTPEAGVVDNVNLMPAKSDQGFVLATFPDIEITQDKKGIRGKIDLEILYGPNKESLRYLFKYEGEPQLGLHFDPSDKHATLKISTLVKQYSHERLGWFA